MALRLDLFALQCSIILSLWLALIRLWNILLYNLVLQKAWVDFWVNWLVLLILRLLHFKEIWYKLI